MSGEVLVRVWTYATCSMCGRKIKKGPLKSDIWLHVINDSNDCPLGTVATPEKVGR